MVNEAYVSFETAKLLKGLKFDSTSDFLYSEDGKLGLLYVGKCNNLDRDLADENYTAPTQSLVMKWLRDTHRWFIRIAWTFTDASKTKVTWSYDIDSLDGGVDIIGTNWFESYEEAVENAIKYCLENLI